MSIMPERTGASADSGSDPAVDGANRGVFETIFCEMEDAVFLVDVERSDAAESGAEYSFRFRRTNQSHQRLTGVALEEIRGKTPRELLGDEQGAQIAENYRRCVEARETIEYEESVDAPSGRREWETRLSPIVEDGTVTQIVGVARDVTEQRAQEREHRRTYRRFKTVLETMSAAVFLKDAEGRYLLMNRACRDLLGIDGDPVGKTDDDLFPAAVADGTRADDRRVLETETQIEVEETIPTPGGDSVRLTRKSPVYNDDGDVSGVCGVSTDITERRERERTLRRLKDRLELAVEGAQLGVWDWDMTSDAVEFNDRWAEMLGHSLDEIAPRLDAWERRVHPDDLGAVREALSSHVAGETEYYDTEHRMRTADGSWKWIRDIGKVVERDAAGDPVRAVGIHLDVDDQKRREAELERTRTLIERTQESASIGWWEVDLVDESLTWSNEVYRIHGVPTDGPVELPDAFGFYHPDDADAVETAFERLKSAGESYDLEVRVVTTAGETRWVRAIGDPQFGGDGAVTGALGLFQDVTELKEYERTLEEQRDNLNLLNQVVRHDIRNQLMVVEAYTELLADSLSDEQSRTYARTVVGAARQATDITETARDVTEVLLQVGADRTPVSLRAELNGQIEQVRSDEDRATVAVDGPIPDVRVLADDLLEAVFRNLLTNAVVHNDKSVAEIAVSARVADGSVRVSIADNGPGIADDHKEQVFQEGEKGLESGGTGLGLYLVKALVDEYDGDVWVEDNEPTGCVFAVELPLAD